MDSGLKHYLYWELHTVNVFLQSLVTGCMSAKDDWHKVLVDDMLPGFAG